MNPSFMLACMDKRLDWLQGRVPGLIEDTLAPYTVQLAGGPLALTDNRQELVVNETKTFLKVAKQPVRFNVILVSHLDCGAYGGDKAFSSLAEQQHKLAIVTDRAEHVFRMAFAGRNLYIHKLIVTNDRNGEVLRPMGASA